MNYKKYFGPYEIDSVEMLDYKTPQGNDIVKVYYIVDGKENYQTMTLKSLEIFSTDNPIDLTSLRDMKTSVIVPELIALIYEYDVKAADVANLGQTMVDQISARFDRADNFLWTGQDDYIPGYDAMQDHTLLEAQRIIDDIPKQNTDGESGDQPQ